MHPAKLRLQVDFEISRELASDAVMDWMLTGQPVVLHWTEERFRQAVTRYLRLYGLGFDRAEGTDSYGEPQWSANDFYNTETFWAKQIADEAAHRFFPALENTREGEAR